MKVRKAIIPAAGQGTRLLPATKTQPKEMLPIYDTPVIQLVVEEAVKSGITEILIITGENKHSLEKHFDIINTENGKLKEFNKLLEKVDITFKRQSTPRGLGDAILRAKNFAHGEPCAILLGDDFYLNCKTPATKQLIDIYENLEYPATIVGVEILSKEKMTKKGMVIVKGESNEVENIIEKPNIDSVVSDLAISGRYIVAPEIFEKLEKVTESSRGEIELTDGLADLLKDNLKIYSHLINGTRIDVGNPTEYLIANLKYALSNDNIKKEVIEVIKSELNID
jgi:UTP--glucose-1-phosphate uridylyltransferase